MSTDDLHYLGLTALAEALRTKALSPVEVTEAILARIEKLDPELKSYTTVTADLARKQARAAEGEILSGRYRGPLHGVPIAVKDLCYTKGIITTAGMAINAGFVPDYDGTIVSRFRDAGAVLLGKLHMTEGATLEHHPDMPEPKNPWVADLWTGVSSSGSGVATAAGLCYGSIGSDTGGSIRYPSACNGLTGVKPTWGRVSRYGVFDLAPSFDTVGPMARSAADCAAMLGAIAGLDPNDPTSLSAPVPDYLAALSAGVFGARGMRIGVDWSFNGAGASADAMAPIEGAAAVLADLGAEVTAITFPDPAPLLEPAMSLTMVELAAIHAATYPSQKERYGTWIAEGIEAGRNADPLDVGRAMIERDKFRGRMTKLFESVDAVLMPVFVGPTPSWSEVRKMAAEDRKSLFRFTSPINAARNPSVTLPCGISGQGRPIAFQLVGPHCAEESLLRIAHAYQQATDWHTKRPPLH